MFNVPVCSKAYLIKCLCKCFVEILGLEIYIR